MNEYDPNGPLGNPGWHEDMMRRLDAEKNDRSRPRENIPIPAFLKTAVCWLLGATAVVWIAGRVLPAGIAHNIQYVAFGCVGLYLILRFFKVFIAIAIIAVLVKVVFAPHFSIIGNAYDDIPHSASTPLKK